MRYLVWRDAGSVVTFSSVAGSAALSRCGFASAGTLGCCTSPTSRANCSAATNSPAVILEAVNAGSPSRLIAACTGG